MCEYVIQEYLSWIGDNTIVKSINARGISSILIKSMLREFEVDNAKFVAWKKYEF